VSGAEKNLMAQPLVRLLPAAALAIPLLASCVPPSGPAAPQYAPPPPATVAEPLPPPPPPPPPVEPAPGILIDATSVEQGALLRGVLTPAGASLTLDGRVIPVAPDGSFILAFDRDAGPDARLVATNVSGTAEVPLSVTPGGWRIEHINAPMRGSARSDEDFRARRAGELAQINAARAMRAESDGWRQSFIWPVRGRISGLFGAQRIYRGTPGGYHSGVDVAVPTGTPFVAPADGVVVLAAETPFTLEGYLLIVDHGMGLSSAFLHNSRLDVRVGDVVRQGQQLGLIGATGRATGPHMHWGMRWGPARIDPRKIAPPM
jgi:hypothetical protein